MHFNATFPSFNHRLGVSISFDAIRGITVDAKSAAQIYTHLGDVYESEKRNRLYLPGHRHTAKGGRLLRVS
jgi:hypothetical protein